MSKAITAKSLKLNKIKSERVWQWIPHTHACHRERQSAICAECIAQYDQLLADELAMWPWCDVRDWFEEIDQALERLATQTAEYHDAELVFDSLTHITPIKFSAQELWQASVDCVSTAHHTSCGVYTSCNFAFSVCQDSMAVVREWWYKCMHKLTV